MHVIKKGAVPENFFFVFSHGLREKEREETAAELFDDVNERLV